MSYFETEFTCDSCGTNDYEPIEIDGKNLCGDCYHEEHCRICENCKDYFDEDVEHIIISNFVNERFDVPKGIYQITKYPFFSAWTFGDVFDIDADCLKFIGVPKDGTCIEKEGFICSDCVNKIEYQQKPITFNQ